MLRKGGDMDCDWKTQYEVYWDAAIDRLAIAAEQKASTEEDSRLNITLSKLIARGRLLRGGHLGKH
jgi:hypothetical protein